MASPEQRRVDTNPVRRNSNRANGVVDGVGRQPSNSPVRIRERKNSFARQVSLESGIGTLEIESAGNNGVGSSSSPPHNKISKHERLLSRNSRSLGVGVGTGVGAKRGDFNMFRTKSTLSKQPSLLPVRKENSDFELVHDYVNGGGPPENLANETVPAGRYFAALRGPELDQVRDYEDILLPKDELWPFLLRFPIGCFGITLGLSSQAILWRAIATSPATAYLHVSPIVNVVLWILALVVLISISITYGLKCAFYFEAVRREYFHPVRVNFFFAPWIVCMFLAIGVPPIITPKNVHPAVWCVFMFPVAILELKIYGQWLSGGKRRLCKVANPSSHLSVVGNFVGAILAAKVGWKEPAKFFWAIGFAHYIVLFVTLYQRLPTNEALPKELHPVYSMFIAAPSAASIAWQMIYGEFDEVSRTCYFIALFLYCSLVVRINFFRGFRFSVAWWSYTFPMTTASLATIKYSEAVPCVISRGLVLVLSCFSSSMVFLLFVCTLMHALYYHTLFPNDLAIAITKNKISGGGKQKDKKGGKKKSYDIRRWAKNAPLSLVSAITKNGNGSHKSRDKD